MASRPMLPSWERRLRAVFIRFPRCFPTTRCWGFATGEHGSTFGGNPLACAVARESLRVLVEEGLIDNAATQGRYLLDGLRALVDPNIKAVRGMGLMTAIELHPGALNARHYAERLKKVGVLVKDTHENTLRLAPPLVITRDDVDWLLEHLDAVFDGAEK